MSTLAAVQEIHTSTRYKLSRGVVAGSTLGYGAAVGSLGFVATGVGLGVLSATDFLVHPKNSSGLIAYTFKRALVAGMVATVAAVAILTLAGVPLSSAAVTSISSILALPTVTTHILELVTATLFSHTLTHKHAVRLFESIDPLQKKKALPLLKQLVNQGHTPSYSYLSRYYSQAGESNKELKILERGFKKKDPDCIAIFVGKALTETIPNDLSQTFDISTVSDELVILKRMKKAGSSWALYYLAYYHYALYVHSSEQEELRICTSYLERGVELDNQESRALLANILSELSVYKRDEARAFQLAKTAAYRGSRRAAKILYRFYRDGVGVKQNPQLAREWKQRI